MNTKQMSSRWWVIGACALLAAVLPAQGEGQGEPGKVKEPAVKISTEARAALAAAKAQAAHLKGKQGDERTTMLEAVAKTYETVATTFAGEAVVAAQASFEAGDLWRRHGSLVLAEERFLAAARLDPARYAQRGTMEAADMQRRQKLLEKAIGTYAAAVKLEPGTSRAQDGRLWQGRLLEELGRSDEALSMFQSALESAQRPAQAIEAANFLARLHVVRGDLDAARQAIAHAEAAVAADGDDDPIEVERLQKALQGMSARKALQRALDKQNKAAGDAAAVDAERQRGGQ